MPVLALISSFQQAKRRADAQKGVQTPEKSGAVAEEELAAGGWMFLAGVGGSCAGPTSGYHLESRLGVILTVIVVLLYLVH